MAIVQISRITQRKGLQEDLPQPLAGAELGWSVDERRLFIGNGELSEGAPVVGNTEILTEYSDLLSFATAYTYQGAAAGYSVQTGATSGTPVSQSLQSRLDSLAIVSDFGATGNGVTDDTDAINRALFQLYCRQVNPQIRRSLFFPAGVYVITDTLLIPPYCDLVGEGDQSSIIYFYVQTWSNTASWPLGTLVVNSGNYYRSILPVPPGISIANATYWQAQSLPACIARTADSLQQSGANIGTNGAIAPRNIGITGMKFTSNMIMDGVLIEDCEDSYLENVSIQGPLTTTALAVNTDDTAGVRWASTASLICTNIQLVDVSVSGFTYASRTDQQIIGCVWDRCRFDTLHQGIYLGDTVVVNGGPTGTRITNSVFDNIYNQGIYIESCELNTSTTNLFLDVANHFNGSSNPAAPVIDIKTGQNLSVGDMFERTTAFAGTHARVAVNNTASVAIDSASRLQLGTYTRNTGLTDTLLDNTATTTLFTVDATTTRAFKVDYTIVRSTLTRTGTFTVVASTDGTGGTLSSSDSGVQNSATGVTLTVSETGSVVSFEYATTATGTDADIYYSLTKLA